MIIQTGADAAWGTPQYLVKGPGMTRESTLFLTEKGVKVVGIDAWSWDRPLPFLAREFKEKGDPKVIWEAHLPVSKRDIAIWKRWPISPPSAGPTASRCACFPVKIKGAGRLVPAGGPHRIMRARLIRMGFTGYNHADR